MYDCLIIGGGPAGLTAAIYLARFHLSVLIVDKGDGRALSIPRTHNHAGFPGGIAGSQLVKLMEEQALGFNATLMRAEVRGVEKLPHGNFKVWWGTPGEQTAPPQIAASDSQSALARTVLLATGVLDRRPAMDVAMLDDAMKRGLLRYCPVCDGYEVTDKSVVVLGSAKHGVDEALFLRSYTRRVTLVCPEGDHDLSADLEERCASAGVELLAGPVRAFSLDESEIVLDTPGGELRFECLYPALGSDVRSALAVQLGAQVSDVGCVHVDRHQRTSVDGLYAAGDVVLGLDQISHAMGEGGVAATTIRNDLAEQSPLLR